MDERRKISAGWIWESNNEGLMGNTHEEIASKRALLSALAKFFVLIGLAILIVTWISSSQGWGNEKFNAVEWTYKSNIGTFIGGIVGSLFSLSGFFLLYLTFQGQKEAFLKERFENKFFELLKLHRENVKEFEISNQVHGRKCFVTMLNEFHYIYKLVCAGYSIESTSDKNYLAEDLKENKQGPVDLAYKIFFFGVGLNSEKQLKHFLTEKQFLFYKEFITNHLSQIQDGYLQFRKENAEGYYEYGGPLSSEKDDLTFETFCFPFDGHSIRLGHYYRLLFQCVKFVDRESEILSKKDKYFYIKTLRAQLSNQEQLLLYYDSLSQFGAEWHKEGFFIKYSFLKNLPLSLVRVSPIPHEKIGIRGPNGKFLFEWDKIKNSHFAEI